MSELAITQLISILSILASIHPEEDAIEEALQLLDYVLRNEST